MKGMDGGEYRKRWERETEIQQECAQCQKARKSEGENLNTACVSKRTKYFSVSRKGRELGWQVPAGRINQLTCFVLRQSKNVKRN